MTGSLGLRTTVDGLIAENSAPIHPGEVLRHEFMAPRRLTAPVLAMTSGLSLSTVAYLLAGETSINEPIARKLADALGTSIDFWMTLQSDYDHLHAAFRL